MKLRSGFVSNSSTSSFICSVCGDFISDRNLDITDCGWRFNDDCGHAICEYDLELASKSGIKYGTGNFGTDYGDEDYEDEDYDESEGYAGRGIVSCPICDFKLISVQDLYAYLEKTTNLSYSKILSELKTRHGKIYGNMIKDSNGFTLEPDGRSLDMYACVQIICEKLNTNRENVMKDIFSKFNSYEELTDFLSNKA